MTRTTAVNITLGALAVGLIASATAWTLLDSEDARAVAPVSVSAVSGATTDPATSDPLATDDASVPSDDPTALPSDDASAASDAPTGAVAVPEGVTVERAQQLALAARPGTVRESELEDEHGRTAWKVEIRDGSGAKWEVYVDAVSGEVLRNERDD